MALTPIPEKYLQPIENGGTVVRIDYKSNTYDESNIALDKYAYVYLPYGYDANKKYDILYTLHGGGGEIDVYFGDLNNEKPTPIKLTLDNMIANGDIEPIIAVSPTYYSGTKQHSMESATFEVINFQYELINDLMPAVESKFSTWAETTDRAGLAASRDHRGYTGYSMGALSTWYTFINCQDCFRWFMPMSGDIWVPEEINPEGRPGNAKYAAPILEEAYQKVQKDFYIFAVTGDKDITYRPMIALMDQIKVAAPCMSICSEANPTDGNLCFVIEPEATHDYFYMPLYFYNALPKFWK